MTQHTGRPRDETIDHKVMQTTLRLMQLYGYTGLRINEIAHRSGIAKTTIYRRWPSLAHLAVAAILQELGERTVDLTGDFDKDLDSFISAYADLINGTNATLVAISLDIHKQNNPELSSLYRKTIIEPVRGQAVELTKLAKVKPASFTDLTDSIIGSLVYRSAILGEQMDNNEIKEYILNLLKGYASAP